MTIDPQKEAVAINETKTGMPDLSSQLLDAAVEIVKNCSIIYISQSLGNTAFLVGR